MHLIKVPIFLGLKILINVDNFTNNFTKLYKKEFTTPPAYVSLSVHIVASSNIVIADATINILIQFHKLNKKMNNVSPVAFATCSDVGICADFLVNFKCSIFYSIF